MPSRPRGGATLLEVTLALALFAVLAAVAVPRAGTMLDRAQVASATTEAATVFATARHLAIRRGRRSTVLIDTATGTLFVRVGADTAHRRPLADTHGVRLVTNDDSMAYHPTGIGYGAANLTLRIEKGEATDTIIVSRLGRVRH